MNENLCIREIEDLRFESDATHYYYYYFSNNCFDGCFQAKAMALNIYLLVEGTLVVPS